MLAGHVHLEEVAVVVDELELHDRARGMDMAPSNAVMSHCPAGASQRAPKGAVIGGRA